MTLTPMSTWTENRKDHPDLVVGGHVLAFGAVVAFILVAEAVLVALAAKFVDPGTLLYFVT